MENNNVNFKDVVMGSGYDWEGGIWVPFSALRVPLFLEKYWGIFGPEIMVF